MLVGQQNHWRECVPRVRGVPCVLYLSQLGYCFAMQCHAGRMCRLCSQVRESIGKWFLPLHCSVVQWPLPLPPLFSPTLLFRASNEMEVHQCTDPPFSKERGCCVFQTVLCASFVPVWAHEEIGAFNEGPFRALALEGLDEDGFGEALEPVSSLPNGES